MSETPVGEEDLQTLLQRMGRIEEALSERDREIRCQRLVLEDSGGQRLVAELVRGVTELRIDLPEGRAGRRTSLLLFGYPGSLEGGPGIGVQLWVNGDMTEEFAWWG